MTRVAILYNPKSGSSKVDSKQIASLFFGLKVKLDYFSITKDLSSLDSKLKKRAYDVLVAVGGDGTVNACANFAAKHNVALGVLPAGTLNHFAKDAGIPLDLKIAAQVIAAGKTKKIDYATVDDKVYVNNASIGIYPTIVIKREKLQSKISKWPAAVIVTIVSLFSNTSKRLTIETPKARYRYKTSMLFVGNNSYQFEKLGFTNRSRLNSGKLFLYVIKDNHSLALVVSTILAFFGKKRQQKDLLLNTKGPIVVHSKKDTLNVTVDGEVLTLNTPFSFCSHPASINLIVP